MSISLRWQDECLVSKDTTFLNVGTLAPTLRCAFQAVYDSQMKWMSMGPGASLEIREARTYLNMMEEQDKCRRIVANWLGVTPSSIALLGNATDGINAALNSIEWKPGDRILTSNEEHEALRYPLAQLKRRFGVEVDTVSFPQANDEHHQFVNEFAQKLNSSTKMVAISEVSHRSGIRLNVADLIATLVNFPEIWLLIDGSHAAGTMTNLIKPRIDFYAFPGHKWIFGPVGTGILWVSERVLEGTYPLMSGSPMISVEGVRYETGDGAWRYEYGTRDWSKLEGLSTAITFRQQWPEETLLSHYQLISAAFLSGFQSECKTTITGEAPLFSFPTASSHFIANNLWNTQKIIVKPQEGNIRISLPPWLDEGDSHELGKVIGREAERL